MDKIFYRMSMLTEDVKKAVERLLKEHDPLSFDGVWGVLRGGVPVAIEVATILDLPLVDSPTADTLICDDVIDSGRTRDAYPLNIFLALHLKYIGQGVPIGRTYWAKEIEGWVVYPWEPEKPARDISDHVVRMLEYIGENPSREGLEETPERVVKSWNELYGGYKKDPSDVMKVFEDDSCDEMVVLKDIEFYSTCEHHMIPFFGKCHVGYVPDGKVIGVSKIARLVEVFARRLQIQERMTQQIAEALMVNLKPKGVMVVCEAKHLCMVARGVGKQNSVMVTSSIKGNFEDEKTRGEFLRLIGK